MDLFPLVKTVLDEIYTQIPLSDEGEKDKAIKCEIETLREKYRGLNNGISIDYSDPVTRFAYIYSYVAIHAHGMYTLIRETPDLRNLFDMSRLRVCSLGGGPGSDLLGMLKFMEIGNKSTTLVYRIYDRQERWRESLGSVCNKLTSFSIVPTFRRFDALDAEMWSLYPEIWRNDLFTMSFLMSEVYSKRTLANNFFMNLLEKAPSGSLFLFIDNRIGYASRWFDQIINDYNQSEKFAPIDCIRESNKSGFPMEDNEREKDLEPYYGKYSRVGQPQRDPVVDSRIYRKV